MDRLLLLFKILIFVGTTTAYHTYGGNERDMSDRRLVIDNLDNGHFDEKSYLLNAVLKKRDLSTNTYCHPPNPCPSGHHINCIDKMFFENTPEFNRNFILGQDCSCDDEHMLNCHYQQLYRFRRQLSTAVSF